MVSAQELFHINRKHPQINLPAGEQRLALEGIKQAFEPEVMGQLFQTAYAVWLEAVWQVVRDPACSTLFDGGDGTFNRTRELRLAGNLLASSNRLFTEGHRNPVGFHQTLHWMGRLKDAIEDKSPLPVNEILGCDSSDCNRYVLGDPIFCKEHMVMRIEDACQMISKPITTEEMHGLRRGQFRDLMHAFQLMAMLTTTTDKSYLLYLASYQNIRDGYDYLDKTRRTAKQPRITLPEDMSESLLSTLNIIKEALS